MANTIYIELQLMIAITLVIKLWLAILFFYMR